MSSLKVCVLLQAFLLAFVQSDFKIPVNYALLKEATQSSTYEEANASRAVDALLETSSYTLVTEDPWWSVDLGSPHLIHEIRFEGYFRRADDNRTERRLNGEGIGVFLSKEVPLNSAEVNEDHFPCGNPIPDWFVIYKCSSKDLHRGVILRASGKGDLFISALFVYGNHFRYNHALSKSTDQSSILYGYEGHEPSRAVDGSMKTCSWTEASEDAWWSVDLGAPYLVDEVLVYQWIDMRLRVYMSKEKTNGSSSEKIVECGKATVGVVKCSSKEKHQHVVMKVTGNRDFGICEVQVYEKEVLINHAWFKETTQSSTARDHESNLAVDADETSCSQTEETVDPWWSLDLGATYLIEKVEIKGELTGETNGPISAEMILSQESSSTLGKHFNRWETIGSFSEIIQNPGNEPYRYLKLKVEGKAGLKVCDVLVLGGLHDIANNYSIMGSHNILLASAANETSPIKQESFNHLGWVLPLFGVVFSLGVLGFIALRLSKKKAEDETVANGSNGQKGRGKTNE